MHVRPNLKSIRLGSRHRRTATKRSICTNARERTEQAKRRAIHPRMCQRALGGSQAPTMRNTSARTDTFRPFEAPAVVERRLPEHSALLVLTLRCRVLRQHTFLGHRGVHRQDTKNTTVESAASDSIVHRTDSPSAAAAPNHKRAHQTPHASTEKRK